MVASLDAKLLLAKSVSMKLKVLADTTKNLEKSNGSINMESELIKGTAHTGNDIGSKTRNSSDISGTDNLKPKKK